MQSGKFGKLNKRVTFPEVLDVSPYMSDKGDRPPLYRLYAVVVHVDMLNASFFGHYICYVKDSQGLWYKIDDAKVGDLLPASCFLLKSSSGCKIHGFSFVAY
jgi:ubiquitin carboxyl-terminal hydrolase 36/42